MSNCTADWSIPFSGTKRWVLFDPDMNATYWYYAVIREESDTTGFRFQGQFPHARYMAYNVYNDETKDLVWAGIDSTNISALSDVDIVPDAGSNNPFLLAVPRDTPERDYTVWVVPEGADTSGLTNVITFPTSVTQLSIFLRVYLPDENTGLSGGVPLPTIESFDTATGQPASCLPTQNILEDSTSGDGNSAPNPGANTDGQVRFYRLGGGGLYPNEDSAYLATIFKEIGDTVAIIRFKPPTYTDTSDPAGIIPAQAMTRYWSFNVYSIKITNVTACLADYQAVVADDGFVYIVLGRRTPELLAKTKGMNFLPWGPHDEILFVYRNITPNAEFPYSAAAVPLYSNDQTASADTFIGDYAPIGVYMSEEEFLKSDPLRFFERNEPWFPSLMAFEHYDSGRSHLFPLAEFGGSLRQRAIHARPIMGSGPDLRKGPDQRHGAGGDERLGRPVHQRRAGGAAAERHRHQPV